MQITQEGRGLMSLAFSCKGVRAILEHSCNEIKTFEYKLGLGLLRWGPHYSLITANVREGVLGAMGIKEGLSSPKEQRFAKKKDES